MYPYCIFRLLLIPTVGFLTYYTAQLVTKQSQSVSFGKNWDLSYTNTPQIEAHFPGQGKWGLYPLSAVFIMNAKGEIVYKMSVQIMGYIVHPVREFHSNTVLFSKGIERITVAMLQGALGQMISIISQKEPALERYAVALKVLRAVQTRLTNQQVKRPSREDLKTACEVLKEVQKEHAETQMQRDRIDTAASWCMMFIECFVRD